MSSNSETGHYKNVVNLKSAKTFAFNLGPKYSPQKSILKLPFLEELVNEANTLHNNVKAQENSTSLAINARQFIFKDVKTLATKVINTMSATDVKPKTIDDAKTINAKIQGTRIHKPKEIENEEVESRLNSVSRQSFDSLYENFKSLVNLAEQDGGYSPEEPELILETLSAKVIEMEAANENVDNENYILGNTRNAREKRFYKDEDGLLAVARGFKKYIRGKFTVNSPEFAQISHLTFVDYSKK